MRIFTLSVVMTLALAATATPADAQKCEAAKLLAFGKHYDCTIGAQAKAVKKAGKIPSPGQPKCGDVLGAKWAKADLLDTCPTVLTAGDALIESASLTNAVTDALAPGAPATSACSARKLAGAGKYLLCRLKAHRKDVLKGAGLDFSKCDTKLSSSFAKAEALAAADCLTTTDLETARTHGTNDSDAIVALLGGAATTTTSTTSTTTLPGSLDDSFDGVALDPAWTVLNPGVATVSVSGSQLHLQIDSQSNWFNNVESILIHKSVTGDFDVQTTLHAAKTSNSALAPDPEYRLGGLLARDPASTPAMSNFVHVALGSGPLAVPFAAEDKTTTDSSSTYFFHPIADTEGELRLTRVGDDFSMYYRPIGDPTWQLLGSATRADLPPTLQVGLMAYDFNASPDITVSFDEIFFD
jgi:hypothetical protein